MVFFSFLSKSLNSITYLKSEAGKKKQRGKKKTEFWKILVDDWFQFYEEKFEAKPTFNPAAAKNLKSIITRLKKLSQNQKKEWTQDYARKVLKSFLNRAYSSTWLKENFLLNNLASKYDAIINSTKNEVSKKTVTDSRTVHKNLVKYD